MSKSDSLRFCDVRNIFRLVGECRDLGHDPGLWYRRMLEGLALLFGVVQATGGEAWWERPGRELRPVSAYSVTAEPRGEAAFDDYMRAAGWVGDPIIQAIEALPDALVTRARRELVSDDAWYKSDSFQRYRRAGGIDHHLVSVFQIPGSGATSVVTLSRALGEHDFSPRETRLLRLFHFELGRLIDGPLSSATDARIAPLSPRLRDTLACLLEGDSEKQAAARLGVSGATLHQYVTVLYRHFAVQSRAQLLARVMRGIHHSDRPIVQGAAVKNGGFEADRKGNGRL